MFTKYRDFVRAIGWWPFIEMLAIFGLYFAGAWYPHLRDFAFALVVGIVAVTPVKDRADYSLSSKIVERLNELEGRLDQHELELAEEELAQARASRDQALENVVRAGERLARDRGAN